MKPQRRTRHRPSGHWRNPRLRPARRARPGTVLLDTETKLITHTIRMAAYNTETALVRAGHCQAPHRHCMIRCSLGVLGTGLWA